MITVYQYFEQGLAGIYYHNTIMIAEYLYRHIYNILNGSLPIAL